MKTVYRIYNQNIWGNMPPVGRIANRHALIAALVGEHAPDVCGFQECNPRTSRAGDDPIDRRMAALGYAEAAAAHAGENFTPLFYKTEKLEEVASGFCPYEGLNDVRSKSYTWAVLRDKENGNRFAAVSTHFWWRWDGEEDDAARLSNVAALLALCKRLAEEYALPVIVMGDLNNGAGAPQGDSAYRALLAGGIVDTRAAARAADTGHTCHHYPILGEDGIYREGDAPYMTLDHILLWNAEALTAHRLAVLRTPAALNSSDHCPMVFEFGL
ncbi:MAG: endonuclease/exonuclease/phosphatase family protein [Clostridia bacterium]|nr:endonuclease/exonuclease/phosphatase family protein [Clostridia bacterium]